MSLIGIRIPYSLLSFMNPSQFIVVLLCFRALFVFHGLLFSGPSCPSFNMSSIFLIVFNKRFAFIVCFKNNK